MGNSPSPQASSPAAHNRMVANRGRDTKPERLLRSALHRMGLRFRIDVSPLKGQRRRADIVFRRAKVAVFVDGCFWHGCPIHGTRSKSNSEFWSNKIRTNQSRDKATNLQLEAEGWLPVRVWEHEPVEEAATRIAAIIHSRVKPTSETT